VSLLSRRELAEFPGYVPRGDVRKLFCAEAVAGEKPGIVVDGTRSVLGPGGDQEALQRAFVADMALGPILA
jgi:hypothetical protein